MTHLNIQPEHMRIVQAILHKTIPEYEVWAFGSRVKGNVKKYSDLDLAIITDKPLIWNLAAQLDAEFVESDLPWKVDIVDWATTNAVFRQIIAQNKIVIQPFLAAKQNA